MKIIHLSDTHVGRDDNGVRLDRLVDDILTLGNPCEHVVIHTGDLINRGDEHVMRAGGDILARLSSAGWRVLLCPGNHDCGDAMKVDPAMARNFRDHFAAYIYADQAAEFPVLTLIDDCALIGLDSNEAELGWPERWFAEGCLGVGQISKLSALLDRTEVRDRFVVLYLHHHPFFDAYVVRPDVGDGHFFSHLFGWNTRRFRRLKDAYSLLQCIRDRVDLLLFGHQHFGLDYSAESQRYGIPRAFDASSSTCTQMHTDRMRYRIVDTQTGLADTRFVDFPG